MKYTVIRLGLFVVLVILFLIVGISALWAAIMAAVIAFCLSYLFLRGPRTGANADIAQRVERRQGIKRSAQEIADADAEDRVVDANPGVGINADLQRKRRDEG